MKNKTNCLIVFFVGLAILAVFMLVDILLLTRNKVTKQGTDPNNVVDYLTPTKVTDQSNIEKINYDNFTDYLTSPSGEKLTLKTFENPAAPLSPYLKICGGILPVYYQLLKPNGQALKDRTELITFIDGIKLPTQAIAYLYVVASCDYKSEFNGQKQFVKIVPEGFEVNLIYRPTFGCGKHEHQLITVVVNSQGGITPKETQLLEHLDNSSEVCVD
jgi:hypothetical protein